MSVVLDLVARLMSLHYQLWKDQNTDRYLRDSLMSDSLLLAIQHLLRDLKPRSSHQLIKRVENRSFTLKGSSEAEAIISKHERVEIPEVEEIQSSLYTLGQR